MDADEAKEIVNSPLVKRLRWMEGVLIRGFEMKQGRRPEWNRNSGADIPYSDDDLAQAVDLGAHCLIGDAFGQ